MKDPYREWSYQNRKDARERGDREGCRKYDEDAESSDRAYQNWLNGNDFRDPDPDGRFH